MTRTYVEQFKDHVVALLKIRYEDLAPQDERNKEVEMMLEEYKEVVGRYPESYWLTKLGTYLLNGDLKQHDVDKVTNTEYPILSESQEKRRLRKQTSVEADTLDFLDTKFNKTVDTLAKKPVKKPEY